MKRPIFVCMVMLCQASQNFQASQNLKNCPEDYPFAVSGGKRCMNIFEVHSNSSEYLYRIGRKFQQCLFLYFLSKHKSGHITRKFGVHLFNKTNHYTHYQRRICNGNAPDCVDYGLPTDTEALGQGEIYVT